VSTSSRPTVKGKLAIQTQVSLEEGKSKQSAAKTKTFERKVSYSSCEDKFTGYLGQETGRDILRFASQAATCSLRLTSQSWRHPVKCLAQRHKSEFARLISTLLLNAERQSGKL